MRDVPPRDIRARTAVVLNFSKMKTHPPHPLSRTPDGAQVLRLCFQSANRGKQLHATLVAPDGSGIATIDMSEGSKSLRSSVGEGIKALAQGRNLGDEDGSGHSSEGPGSREVELPTPGSGAARTTPAGLCSLSPSSTRFAVVSAAALPP